jgi:hypothetical protein
MDLHNLPPYSPNPPTTHLLPFPSTTSPLPSPSLPDCHLTSSTTNLPYPLEHVIGYFACNAILPYFAYFGSLSYTESISKESLKLRNTCSAKLRDLGDTVAPGQPSKMRLVAFLSLHTLAHPHPQNHGAVGKKIAREARPTEQEIDSRWQEKRPRG